MQNGKLISFCIAVAILMTTKVPASVEKNPYLLFEGDNTKMAILWQLTATKSYIVKWGLTKSYELGSGSASKFGTDYQYRYDITELTPGTKYYYSIDGIDSGSFYTAPPSGSETVKILAYGDTRSYPADHDKVCKEMLNTINATPLFQTIAILSGDYASKNTESSWSSEFFPLGSSYKNMNKFRMMVPIVGPRGNHEATGTVFKKYYPFPHVGSFYWSFDYGPVHVVVIDDETNFSPGSAQYNWLLSDLAATDKEWKIITHHSPGYSAGGGHANFIDAQKYIQPICVDYGVDLLISGDNHYYSRAVVDGVFHLTSGGGGAPLYTPDLSYPYIKKADKSNHFIELEFNKGICDVLVRRADGSVIEKFKIEHIQTDISLDNLNYQNPDKFNIYSQGRVINFKYSSNNMNFANISITIYNLMGQSVVTLNSNQINSVKNGSLLWDKKSILGNKVSAGIFIAVCEITNLNGKSTKWNQNFLLK